MRNYVIVLILAFGVAGACKKEKPSVPTAPVAPATTCIGVVCASGVVVTK